MGIGPPDGMRKQYHLWPGRSGLDAWDVDRLIELTAGLAVEQVEVTSIVEVDSDYWFSGRVPTVREVVAHVELIANVDPRHPIILGPDGRVMDGMHRIARALVEGRETIAAVRLVELPDPDVRDCVPEDLPYER